MRIRQVMTRLLDVHLDLLNGLLAPAAFQRDYVWDRRQVLAMCTSLSRRLPIGGILTWTPSDPAILNAVVRPRLAFKELSTVERHMQILLDGQQRMTTMAWFQYLHGAPLPSGISEQEAAVWCSGDVLVANLHARTFEFVPVAKSHEGMRVPMRAVIDLRYGAPLTRARYSDEWLEFSEAARDAGLVWLSALSDAFREALVVQTHLEGASTAEAREAFLHICQVGQPMSAADFDKSLAWALDAERSTL